MRMKKLTAQPRVANTQWFSWTSSDTVIVFVHGILSDSRSAWLQGKQDTGYTYWPHLVSKDSYFQQPSIFLCGFYAKNDASFYEIQDASEEVYRGLINEYKTTKSGTQAAYHKDNLLFVCHSTGGIVITDLLCRHKSEFLSKTIGLLLFASPAKGSRLADCFRTIARLYNNKLASQLCVRSKQRNAVFNDFKQLLSAKTANERLTLVGAEAIEHHFLLHWKMLPLFNRLVVVSSKNVGEYWGAPSRLPQTNHFSIVKPDSVNHPAHLYLRQFYREKFLKAISQNTAHATPGERRIQQLGYSLKCLCKLYEGASEDTQIRKRSRAIAIKLLNVRDEELDGGYKVHKYEYLTAAYNLALSVEFNNGEKIKLSENAIKSARAGLKMQAECERLASPANPKMTISALWGIEENSPERLNYLLANALATNHCCGGSAKISEVFEAASKVGPEFLKEHLSDCSDLSRTLSKK